MNLKDYLLLTNDTVIIKNDYIWYYHTPTSDALLQIITKERIYDLDYNQPLAHQLKIDLPIFILISGEKQIYRQCVMNGNINSRRYLPSNKSIINYGCVDITTDFKTHDVILIEYVYFNNEDMCYARYDTLEELKNRLK